MNTNTEKILDCIVEYLDNNGWVDLTTKNHLFTIANWNSLTIFLLEKIYPDNITIDNEREISLNPSQIGTLGGHCWLNPEYESKFISDINNITFISFYPNIIVKLYKEGKLVFNNSRIGDLFSDVLNVTLDDIKNYKSDLSYEKYLRIYKGVILNAFYGVLVNKYQTKFYCNDINLVTKYGLNFWNELKEDYSDKICYVDTDEIFCFGETDSFLKKFDSTGLPYTTTMRTTSSNLVTTLLNSKRKLKDDFIGEIINENRSIKLKNIFEDNIIPITNIGYFIKKKQYLIFNQEFELIRSMGI